MANATWLVVVDPTAVVVSVSGGAPEAWSGHPILDDDARPLADAARALATEVSRGAASATRRVTMAFRGATVEVELVAITALALVRTPLDLRAVIHRAVEPFRGQAADRDVALEVFADDEGPITMGPQAAPNPGPLRGPTVLGDNGKITWVVATLVGNALRFVRAGTRRLPGGSILVHFGADVARNRAVIVVEDDGSGIEPDRLRYLFEQRDELTPAAGVALKMARDVVLAHGGAFWVDSSTDAEAHGTTAHIELPLVSPSQARK